MKGSPHDHTTKYSILLTKPRAIPPHQPSHLPLQYQPPHQYYFTSLLISVPQGQQRLHLWETCAKDESVKNVTLTSSGHIWDTTTLSSLLKLSAWGLEKLALESTLGWHAESPWKDRRCPVTPQCLPGPPGQQQHSSSSGFPQFLWFLPRLSPPILYSPTRTPYHQKHSVRAGFGQLQGLQ